MEKKSKRVKIKATLGTPIKMSRGMKVRLKEDGVYQQSLMESKVVTAVDQIKVNKIIRKSLSIGDKVLVIPRERPYGMPRFRSTLMYVRELHNPNTAGLSYKPKIGCVYGIVYEIIHPIVKPKTKKK